TSQPCLGIRWFRNRMDAKILIQEFRRHCASAPQRAARIAGRYRMRRLALMTLLALAAVSASSARRPVRTMPPSPIVTQHARLDFSRLVPPGARTTEMSLLFATTREPAPPDAAEHFTRRTGDAVRLGVARVQLGKPEWSFDDLIESDRASRPDSPRPARVV